MKTLLLLCFIPVVAFAAQPRGEWRGTIPLGPDHEPTPLVVRFKANHAYLHFQGSIQCSTSARFSEEEEGGTLRYFVDWFRGGDGFCQRMEDHAVRMTPKPNGRLSIDYDTGITRWHGTLEKTGNLQR